MAGAVWPSFPPDQQEIDARGRQHHVDGTHTLLLTTRDVPPGAMAPEPTATTDE